jgi:hexokinase
MVIKTMTFQGNLIQASIEEAINQRSILGTAINRGSILEKSNKSKTYCGKAINPVYWSLPNNRLKLTAHLADIVSARSLA